MLRVVLLRFHYTKPTFYLPVSNIIRLNRRLVYPGRRKRSLVPRSLAAQLDPREPTATLYVGEFNVEGFYRIKSLLEWGTITKQIFLFRL